MNEDFKSGEMRYRTEFTGKLDWRFLPGVMTSQIGDTVLIYHPNFRFIYSNMVTITHIDSSEFYFYFSDFFPYTNILDRKANEYKVNPTLRVIYPVFNINTFLHLSEKIAHKYTKVEEPATEAQKVNKVKLTPVIQQMIPTFYANNAYFFYDGSGDDFRIIFGEIGKGKFKIDMEDPSGESIPIEGKKGFQVSLGVIIPSRVFLNLISALKRNIEKYEEKYGTLPIKPLEKSEEDISSEGETN